MCELSMLVKVGASISSILNLDGLFFCHISGYPLVSALPVWKQIKR